MEAIRSGLNVKVIPSAHGLPTATFTTPDGREYYLHSRYDPIAEAEHWVSTISPENRTLYVILGFGLGYHVKALLRKIPKDAGILVVESHAESMASPVRDYYNSRGEKWINDPRLEFIANDDPQMLCFSVANHFIKRRAKTLRMLTHIPSAMTNRAFYASTAHTLSATFTDILMANLANLEKNLEYNLVNLWSNLPVLWRSPSVDHFAGKWRGQPAIVVSAGPSLNKNILLLKKAKNRALLLCVGTAAKALAKQGITPDFVISVDPYDANVNHFQGWGTESIPLIMYSKIAREIPARYQGEKFWLTMAADDPIPLTPVKHQPFFYAGGTVAFSALQFAYYTQANPVIFVGQDFAFTGGRSHADGCTFVETIDETAPPPDHLWVPGNNGTPVLTTRLMNRYRLFMQGVVSGQRETLHINATEGGAVIEGMTVMPLAAALERYCQKEITSPGDIIREAQRRFTPVVQQKAVTLLTAWITQLGEFLQATSDCADVNKMLAAFKRTDVYAMNQNSYGEVFYCLEIQEELSGQKVTHRFGPRFQKHCRLVLEQLQAIRAEMGEITS